MSSMCSQQTRIDQFYRVVSNKKIGCGSKLLDSTTNQKTGTQRSTIKSHRVPRKNTQKMPLVESEVQIVKVLSPDGTKLTPNKHKRTSSLELENSPKKHKPDANRDYERETDLTLKKVKSPSYDEQTKTLVPDIENSPERVSNTQLNTPPKVKDAINISPKQQSNSFQTPPKTNYQSPLKVLSPSAINSSVKKSNFSPKTPRGKNNLSARPQISPRKLFFPDRVNADNVQQAIENLNLVRQGSIVLNEFDLESIYKNREFAFIFNKANSSNSQKYEIKDVVFPNEKHADHLMMIIGDVFSNPVNCGYFTQDELNTIFLLYNVSPQAQMLFVRLLKRKLGWHRTNSIKYPEIASDLKPFFQELVENKLCSSDLDSTDIAVLLNMLQADEVRNICRELKIDHKGNKTVLMTRLLNYGNSSKSFFLGAKSPKAVLRSKALLILKPCVCLPDDIINLFDRVITLLHPVQDPTESTADFFLTLTNIHKGEVLYPPIPKNEPFPIFQNRIHLIDFVQSKNAYREVLACIEKKEWDTVKELGRKALKKLSEKRNLSQDSTLPLHIRKFIPGYSWTKVLSRSIDAFKKNPETIPEAINALKTLIDEKDFTQSSRGRWYSELALIEMYHRKDLESSAALTIHALQQDSLTEVDISDLLERLKKLLRRKNGISKETRMLVQEAQENIEKRGLAPQPNITKTIKANMANRCESAGKSTWSVNINGNDKYYGSVEVLALQHYTSKEGFTEGLHCEGSLPITLFAVFFWDELYNTFVPGVFISPYQDAPLDLFTAEFLSNRRESIEEKINFIRALDLESFSEWMHGRYSNYVQYKSVMSNTLFKSEEQFKDVVTCLGINGVIGICERLVANFRLWRSGFPDLIVWNVLIPKCKIVEVKGPGDSLSEKQKLWLQYLEHLGIEAEVCKVEALGRGSK